MGPSLRTLFAWALILLGTTLTAPRDAAARESGVVVRTTLANGLHVAVVPDHAVPVAQVAMWYRFGSAYEKPRKTGLAHALEHMMFRGTNDLSEAGRVDLETRLGIDWNAETDFEYTHYFQTLTSSRAGVAIRIEADRMRNLLLHQRDWEFERGAVLAEYDDDLIDSDEAVENAVRRALYAGTPWAYGPLGARPDLVDASATDLRRYYEEAYTPDNATLVVTGDVDPHRIIAIAADAFGHIHARASLASLAPERPTAHNVNVTVGVPYGQTVVDVVLPASGALAPDAAAETVAALVLKNPDSELNRALVEHDLCASYDVDDDVQLHGGLRHVLCQVNEGASNARIARAVTAALRAMAAHPSLPAIEEAKRDLHAETIFARDGIASEGDRAGFALGVLQREPESVDRAIAAVGPEAVARVIRRWSTPLGIGTTAPRAVGPLVATTPHFLHISHVERPDRSLPADTAIVQPAWARAALSPLPRLVSRTDPVAFTLANGMRVYVQPIRGNGTVYVRALLDDPRRFVPADKPGLGSVTAAIVENGSVHWTDERIAHTERARAMSVDLGAVSRAHGLAEDLPTMLDILADAWRAPRLDAETLAAARESVVADQNAIAADPDRAADALFARYLAFPNSPPLQPLSTAAASRLSLEDIRRFFGQCARPERAQIIIAGDVDPGAARDQVEQAFGSWHVDGPSPPPFQTPRIQKRVVRILYVHRKSVRVQMGQPAPAPFDPDFAPMLVMNQMLGAGGGFDTRLMRELRIRRGLVYDVSSAYDLSRSSPNLTITFQTDSWNVVAARTAVRRVLEGMRSAPPSSDELERAKEKLIANTISAHQSVEGVVSQIAMIARNRLPADFFQHDPVRLRAVTSDDVVRVARARLIPDRLVEIYEGLPY